ncbi:hypothetical protein A0K93_05795 [Corynebacterium sp. BCW_4722]|nr:hypothetical protein A0K93_05795 [Corynebacterium sp. BCW_4722]
MPQVAAAYNAIPSDPSQPGGLSDEQAEQLYVQGRNGDGPYVTLGADLRVNGKLYVNGINNGGDPKALAPNPGDVFEYVVYPQPVAPVPVEGNQVQPGESDIEQLAIVLNLPAEAPLLRAPRPSDFRWTVEGKKDGERLPSLGFAEPPIVKQLDDGRTEVRVNFENIPSTYKGVKYGLYDASFPARLDPDTPSTVDDGQGNLVDNIIGYRAYAETGIKPYGTWITTDSGWVDKASWGDRQLAKNPNVRKAYGEYVLDGGEGFTGKKGQYLYPYTLFDDSGTAVSGQTRRDIEKVNQEYRDRIEQAEKARDAGIAKLGLPDNQQLTPDQEAQLARILEKYNENLAKIQSEYVNKFTSRDSTGNLIFDENPQTLTTGPYGQWMQELWLGTNLPYIDIVGTPDVTFEIPKLGGGTETIKLSEMLAGSDPIVRLGTPEELSNGPSDKGAALREHPNAIWRKSYQWDFNGSDGGRLWLPSGTKIRVENYVENRTGDESYWKFYQQEQMITSAYNRVTAESIAGVGQGQGLRGPVNAGFYIGEGGRNNTTPQVSNNSLGDRVWVDENANGIQDEGENEGVAGVRVTATPAGNGQALTTTTNSNGEWLLEGLDPGIEYTINFELPEPTYLTPDRFLETRHGVGDDRGVDSNGNGTKVTLGKDEKNLSYDFGVVREASVGDRVWLDRNNNGIQDQEESSGVANVKVRATAVEVPAGLNLTAQQKVAEATTNASGQWRIGNLYPGVKYEIQFDSIPEGYGVTASNKGTDRAMDSNGIKSEVTLKSGEYNRTYDLGLTETASVGETPQTSTSTTTTPATSTTADCDCTPVTVTKEIRTTVAGQTTTITTTATEVIKESEAVTIGDKVFIDANGNGKQDPGEDEGVEGITIVITNTRTGNVSRTVTDKDGNWKAIGKPGEYEIKFETGRRVSSNPDLVTRVIEFKPGEKRDDIDLPVLPEGSVGDRVWNDINGDGKQDDNEQGVPNVVVKVSREGEPVRYAVTDDTGNWSIEGLTPNVDYTVTYIQPEGWNVTGKVPNADASGLTTTVTLEPGQANNDIDLGIQRDNNVPDPKPGTLTGTIWLDGNRNGDNDGGEKGYEGIEVRIYEPGKNEPFKTTSTDKDGAWFFTGLTPGVDYRVEYNIPEGYEVTTQPNKSTVVNNTIQVTVNLDGNKPFELDLDYGLGKSSTVVVKETKTVNNTVTETTTVQAPREGSSTDVLGRCWANAKASPLLYLTPIALLGVVGGKLAEPYLGAVNEQLAQFNAEIQATIRRNTPDWGTGEQGRHNDPFAGFRAQIDAANREAARIANDPNVQRLGQIAVGIIGLIAAGAVVYDWCSSEEGKAVTASSIGDRSTTAPTQPTEPAPAQ